MYLFLFPGRTRKWFPIAEAIEALHKPHQIHYIKLALLGSKEPLPSSGSCATNLSNTGHALSNVGPAPSNARSDSDNGSARSESANGSARSDSANGSALAGGGQLDGSRSGDQLQDDKGVDNSANDRTQELDNDQCDSKSLVEKSENTPSLSKIEDYIFDSSNLCHKNNVKLDHSSCDNRPNVIAGLDLSENSASESCDTNSRISKQSNNSIAQEQFKTQKD